MGGFDGSITGDMGWFWMVKVVVVGRFEEMIEFFSKKIVCGLVVGSECYRGY